MVLGSAQRRNGERRAAKDTLSLALADLNELGATAWADMAEAELRRIGIRRSPPDTLTENERHIAELAASGLTNAEIASRMFQSRRTVEANLARVYRKLGVRSRAELGVKLTNVNS